MTIKCSMLFDAHVPTGETFPKHLRTFRKYLLELADACPGFRLVVTGHHGVQLFLDYMEDFKPTFVSIPAGKLTSVTKFGTWRGYPVWVDPNLALNQGYLADKLVKDVQAEAIGFFEIMNWGSYAHK